MNFKETKEKNGKAGDGDGESSRESSDGSDESIVSSSSDSDSDSEADIAKKHVLNALHKKELAAAAEAKANAQPPPRSGMADLGVLTEPPSQAHRAAFVSEQRYWRATKIAYAFGGKGMARTIEVKRGAVTSLAHAASGRGQVLAAGTSKGELVVWKFAPPGDGSGDTDSEDEKERKQALGTEGTKNTTKSPTKSPNKKLSKTAQKALDAKARTEFYEKAEKKKARERMKLLTPAPVIIARAECTFHPESEMQTEEGGVPSAQYRYGLGRFPNQAAPTFADCPPVATHTVCPYNTDTFLLQSQRADVGFLERGREPALHGGTRRNVPDVELGGFATEKCWWYTGDRRNPGPRRGEPLHVVPDSGPDAAAGAGRRHGRRGRRRREEKLRKKDHKKNNRGAHGGVGD